MGTGDISGARGLGRPGTRGELREWVREVAGLTLPGKGVCPGHDTPLDYLAYAFLEEGATADTVVWACRGGGKTMIGAVATLLDLLFKPGIQVKILGGSKEQSLRMYNYLCELVEETFGDQVQGKVTAHGLRLVNGSRVEILTQSQRAVRGNHVQKMRCDELEMFQEEVWSAAQLTTRSLLLEEAGSRKGRRVRGAVEVFSTLHKPSGLMAKLVARTACPLGALAAPLGEEARERRVFRWCIWDVMAECREEERACAGCALEKGCGGRGRQAEGFVTVEDVLALQRRASQQLWETEMLCHLPVPERQVFAAFGKGHVRAFPLGSGAVVVDGRRLALEGVIAGIDYGWKRFVCVWVALLRDAAGRRVAWVMEEYVGSERSLEGHAAVLLAREAERPAGLRARVFYADVAGRAHDAHSGQTSEMVLREAGLTVKSRAMKIAEGVEMIRWLVDPPETWGLTVVPRLLVDPRCGQMMGALTQLQQKEGMPVKDGEHDHLVDALRYALVGQDGAGGKVERREY